MYQIGHFFSHFPTFPLTLSHCCAIALYERLHFQQIVNFFYFCAYSVFPHIDSIQTLVRSTPGI